MCDFLDGNEEIQTHGHKLPHWQQSEVMQFVTFRLADAMPTSKVAIWREQRDIWLQHHPKPWDKKTTHVYHCKFTTQLEKWLDQNMGSCLFRKAQQRSTLEQVLIFDEAKRVEHISWVIMPNHVHALFTPKHPLPELIKSWKGISARKIGKGSIWQKNYRDTLIRDYSHFANAVRYIRRNPKHLPESDYTLWESERAKAVK